MGTSETAIVIQQLEARTGFTFPDALRRLYLDAPADPARQVRLLHLRDVAVLLDNWPRYGFEPGYLPIAEDKNGDLFCVHCEPPEAGHVFHLQWAGNSVDRFESVERFIEVMLNAAAD